MKPYSPPSRHSALQSALNLIADLETISTTRELSLGESERLERAIQRANRLDNTHARLFRPWTPSDDHKLAYLVSVSRTADDIATQLDRTSHAVRRRIHKLKRHGMIERTDRRKLRYAGQGFKCGGDDDGIGG